MFITILDRLCFDFDFFNIFVVIESSVIGALIGQKCK